MCAVNRVHIVSVSRTQTRHFQHNVLILVVPHETMRVAAKRLIFKPKTKKTKK